MIFWRHINSVVCSIIFLATIFLMPSSVQAQTAAAVQGQAVQDVKEEYVVTRLYSLEQPFGGKASVDSLGQYVKMMYQYAISLVGIIAVVLIMFGGLQWISAAGNESKIGEAKEIIVSAVSGLVIALLSYTILVFINPRLVDLNYEVFVIPIQNVDDFPKCDNDGTLVEDTGAKSCSKYNPPSTHADVDANTLNGWVMKYNSGLSVTFIKAIMQQESNFCLNARSKISGSTGACGIMQMMPATASTFSDPTSCNLPACKGVKENTGTQAETCCQQIINSPENAVCAGVKYLNSLYNNSYVNKSERLTAAAYNGGTCNTKTGNGALCQSKACPGKYVFECDQNWGDKDGSGKKGYYQTWDYVQKVAEKKINICAKNVATRQNACKKQETSGAMVPGKCLNKCLIMPDSQKNKDAPSNASSNYFCYDANDKTYRHAVCNSGAVTCIAAGKVLWTVESNCDYDPNVKRGVMFESKSVTATAGVYSTEPFCATI